MDYMFDQVLTDKDIRQFLVELTKQRAIDLLDMASDKNIDNQSLTLIGTSPKQVAVVRGWLSRIAFPLFLETMEKIIKDKEEKDGNTGERGSEHTVRNDERRAGHKKKH